MSPKTGNIEHLDPGTRSKLRSTQILTSLPQIISELVQNSLDAGAKHVDVGVNREEWGCWVRDDGAGISKDGLAVIAQGSEAGRYATSKAYNPSSLDNVSTFGFRGEALASAADMSCIEISSRTARSKESWSIILKGGEKLYNGASVRWRRETPGTAVSIRDAFFNLPIRRLSHPSPARTLDLIRRDLEAHALVFPHVAFTFEDTAKERKDGSGKGRIMTIPKTSSTLSAFRHLYGRALVEHVDEINVPSGAMTLTGFISLDGAHSKACQFIYVNRHLLDPCDLHRLIDQKFAASSFSKHAYDETGETRSPRSASRRSPRKGEKRPVYVLNLHIPPREIDNCLEPAKATVHFQNQDAVSSLIGGVIQSFLLRHGFNMDRRSEGNVASASSSPSPRKRRRVEQLIDDSNHGAHASTSCLLSTNEKAKSKTISILGTTPTEDNAEMTWTDPVSGQTFLVDPRTGNSYLRSLGSEGQEWPIPEEALRNASNRRAIVDTRWLKRFGDEHCDDDDDARTPPQMPDWIRKALQGNEAFALTEPGIPAVKSTSTFPAMGLNRNHGVEHYDRRPGNDTSDNEDDEATISRWLSKEALANVEVIDQIDRKFIACLTTPTKTSSQSENAGRIQDTRLSTGRTLFLIDQHAADERVRVERYLKALCLGFLDHGGPGVKTRRLEPPKPVLLTSFECDRLAEPSGFREAFAKWGFTIRDPPRPDRGAQGEGGYVQVHFTSVPDVVSTKLLVGDELRELVKGFLARLDTEGVHYPDEERQGTLEETDVVSDQHGWLKALRWCPQELVDLVNSRACRGAIMFNDPLSPNQCKRLIQQLSQTAFPFQCAHGRPSLVPISQLDCGEVRIRKEIDWRKLTKDGGSLDVHE